MALSFITIVPRKNGRESIDGSVAMFTRPLDLNALLRDAR